MVGLNRMFTGGNYGLSACGDKLFWTCDGFIAFIETELTLARKRGRGACKRGVRMACHHRESSSKFQATKCCDHCTVGSV